MYCPGCGANNKSETKFCTKCGTDLAVVAEALAGNRQALPQLDERMVRIFKNSYQGKRAIAIGIIALAIAMSKLFIGDLLNMPDGFPNLYPFLLAIAIYGLLALLSGLSKWTSASSEIKAIERASQGPLLSTPQRQSLHDATQDAAMFDVPARRYDTDSMAIPSSVTEQTTRQLGRQDERVETEAKTN